MFGASGAHVNNVLASMTDKIVCATFSADPNIVLEDDEDEPQDKAESPVSSENMEEEKNVKVSPALVAPISSLALAAAPLLTTNFSYNQRTGLVMSNYSAPNSRRSSYQPDVSTPMSVQLNFVGDYTSYGSLSTVPKIFHLENTFENGAHFNPAAMSTTSLCTPTTTEATLSMFSGQGVQTDPLPSTGSFWDTPLPLDVQRPNRVLSNEHVAVERGRTRPQLSANNSMGKRWSYPLSPEVIHKASSSPVNATSLQIPLKDDNVTVQVDCTVRSGQATPRPVGSSRSPIDTNDRDRFTDEVTV